MSDNADKRDDRPTTPNLVSAICQVMAEVGHVLATGYNKHDGYAYASGDDLLAKVQPALARAGLAMWPAEVAVTEQAYRTKSGELRGIQATVVYQLQHTSGETIRVVALGEGADRLDKARAKAMTGAQKIALRQLFAIATVDEEPEPAAPPAGRAPKPGPVEICLDQEVIPGRPRTWLELGLDQRDWVRSAASGELAAEKPDVALYRDRSWQAHAKARLAELNQLYRQKKRGSQILSHSGGSAHKAVAFVLEHVSDERRAQLGRAVEHVEVPGEAFALLLPALMHEDLSALKSALKAAGYDVDADVE